MKNIKFTPIFSKNIADWSDTLHRLNEAPMPEKKEKQFVVDRDWLLRSLHSLRLTPLTSSCASPYRRGRREGGWGSLREFREYWEFKEFKEFRECSLISLISLNSLSLILQTSSSDPPFARRGLGRM